MLPYRVGSMKRTEMLDIARRELAHIPDYPLEQRVLRSVYWNLRMNSLGRKSEVADDPMEVLKRAIRVCQRDEPGQKYEFDRAFFEAESRKRRPR